MPRLFRRFAVFAAAECLRMGGTLTCCSQILRRQDDLEASSVQTYATHFQYYRPEIPLTLVRSKLQCPKNYSGPSVSITLLSLLQDLRVWVLEVMCFVLLSNDFHEEYSSGLFRLQDLSECVCEVMRFVLAQNHKKPLVPISYSQIQQLLKALQAKQQNIAKCIIAHAQVKFLGLGWQLQPLGPNGNAPA
jgi:hypothetical protein